MKPSGHGGPVAVIDIGSNSIKSLAATRDPGGALVTLKSTAIDARISAGIGGAQPRLAEARMQAALTAIGRLLAELAPLAPRQTELVATSAVRDAANGAAFRARVRAATGLGIRILSGDEEARLIGRGLITDPALAALRDFYVFDLGGGSLECLSFRARQPIQAVSLALGCVRLTERCGGDPRGPFDAASRERVLDACRAEFAASSFRFDLPADTGAVFTGGTVTTARAILAARQGRPLGEVDAVIPVATLRHLLEKVAPLPLNARQQIAGLPAARADVFPTALATVIAVAEAGGFPAFRHSFHNLRYGVAAEMLDA